MSVLETDRLSQLIHQKHDCLIRLRDMGQAQLKLVQEERLTDLLDVLSAKQRVLLELQGVERALDPFRDQDPQSRVWRTADARWRCVQELAQCQLLLGEIIAQEKQSEQELIRRRDQTAARLQGVHRASLVRGAYTASPSDHRTQIDLTSET